MNSIMKTLDGKKTYIIAGGIAAASVAQYFGYQVPEWAWMLANAAGFGAIRSGIAKAQAPLTPGVSATVDRLAN